jgi:PST family polysaccharide transporter
MDQPSHDPRPLKQAIRTAIYGGGTLLVVSQIAGFLILAALLKTLNPSDFGLLGMILPVLLGVRMVAVLGPAVTVVQREHLTDAQLSTLFWTLQALGLAGTLLLAALGPVLAWYNSRPDLTLLTVALSATASVFSCGALHQAMLQRDLHHTRLAAIALTAQLVSGGVGIAAAVAGCGVWSLVLLHHGEAFTTTLLAWWCVPFRPGPPRWAEGASEVVGFGSRYTLASVLLYTAQQLDKLLLGAFAGDVALGLYNQAYNLTTKVVYLINGSLSTIILPALSRARTQPETFSRLIAAFFRIIAGVLFPAAAGLSIVAPDAILVLGDERWSGAGILLRIMALAIVAQAFFNIAGTLLTAAGRVDLLLAASWVVLAVLAASAAIALGIGRAYGDVPLAMAWTYVAVMVGVLCIPYLWWCLHSIGVQPVLLWQACWRPALSTLAMSVVVIACRYWLLTNSPEMAPAVRLVIQIGVGIAANAVFACSELFWLRRHWREFRGRA